jgi:2-oxoglutarate decarboxylase
VRWVQEEPENMGGWSYVAFRLPALLGGRPPLTVRSRPASASPAAGSSKAHEEQQKAVVTSAFAD